MQLTGANITGSLGVAVIFVALVAGGANTGALAAYLAAGLFLLLGARVLATPASLIAVASRRLALPIIAALAFAFLALASALTLPTEIAAVLRGLQFEGSLSKYRTIEGLAAFGAPMAAFAIGTLSARATDEPSFHAKIITGLTVAYCIWGLAAFAEGGAPRLDAGLGSANTAACIYGMLAIFVLAVVLKRERQHIRTPAASPFSRIAAAIVSAPLATTAFALCIVCLALTLSRGGFIATGAGLAVLALSLGARGETSGGAKFGLYALSATAFAGLCAFILLKRDALALAGAARGGDTISVESRQTLIEVYWRAFLDRPIWGSGLNTYHELSSLASNPENWEALRTSGSVHNIYVQSLAETGIVGTALLGLAVLIPILGALWRGISSRHGEMAIAAGALGALCLTQGLVDFGLQTPAIAALLAFVLGNYGTTRRDLSL